MNNDITKTITAIFNYTDTEYWWKLKKILDNIEL